MSRSFNSMDKTRGPEGKLPLFRGSFRPKKYFPTARFESYLLSTMPPLFRRLSLPFEVRVRIYIALDGVTDTQTGAGVYVGARFGAGSILISIQSRTISSGSTFEERERGFCFCPRPTLQPLSPLTPLFVRVLTGCSNVAIFWIFLEADSGKNYVNRGNTPTICRTRGVRKAATMWKCLKRIFKIFTRHWWEPILMQNVEKCWFISSFPSFFFFWKNRFGSWDGTEGIF